VRRSTKQVLARTTLVVAILVLGGVIVWGFWPEPLEPPSPRDANTAGGSPADANSSAGTPASQPVEENLDEIQKLQGLSAAEAIAAVGRGNQLLAAKKFAEGRVELSKAVLSGALPPASADAARKTLTELAEKMTFSRRVFDGDPYAMQYTFQPREVLAKVERKLHLHVPTQVLLRINGIRDARSIRAGQTLKVLLGPFHAVVSKSGFIMDVYLQRDGSEPVFVKRLHVGVGKNGSTPVGLWRVGLGRKLVRAPWNPPPNSPIRKSIAWGEPDYPLGTMGYWLGLEGVEDGTRLHEGYGIHGTNDPASIGKAESLGCIRLADADIEEVFSLLYEKWSTVRVLP